MTHGSTARCALFIGLIQGHHDFCQATSGQGHTLMFTIEHRVASGWVACEHDDRATRTSMIRDWRQVEATMALFELKASALRNEGWLEIAPNAEISAAARYSAYTAISPTAPILTHSRTRAPRSPSLFCARPF